MRALCAEFPCWRLRLCSHTHTHTRRVRPQICYYGKHFVAFVKQPPSAAAAPEDWISYDDANVRNLGSDFDAVRERCAKAHWQPLLLFYEKPEPT